MSDTHEPGATPVPSSGLAPSSALALSSDAQQAMVDVYIFNSDVNEVFLLIDHISGRSEKSLKQLDTEDIELPAEQGAPAPLPGTQPGGTPSAAGRPTAGKPSISDVLERLCQIGYPPAPDPLTKANKAAFVLALKDRLNALASPARGITIAYTTMFIAVSDGCRAWSWPWGKAAAPLAKPSARNDLARSAYPALESHARCFSKLFRALPWAMLAVLIITASAYWDVGFGRTIVQRIEQLDKQRSDLLHPDRQATPSAAAVNEVACRDNTGLSVAEAQACDSLRYLQVQIKASRDDLYNFAIAASAGQGSSWFLFFVDWIRPIHYGFVFNGQTPPQDRPEASVTWVLSLFSTYVLPAMFGLLGTLAAIMRAIQAKVRDSLLGPRDLPLSMLGLIVGPIAGLAVGLFYTPTGAAAAGPAGLAGAVSLSASGLGFIAGYGADAFFKFLDALLVRIFALEQSGK